MMWRITGAQDEESFFDTYVRDLLIQDRPPLPPRKQRFAHVETHWIQVGPGAVQIRADGGSHADRFLARVVVAEQLRAHGLREAQESFDDHEVWNRRTADWNDEDNAPIFMEPDEG